MPQPLQDAAGHVGTGDVLCAAHGFWITVAHADGVVDHIEHLQIIQLVAKAKCGDASELRLVQQVPDAGFLADARKHGVEATRVVADEA